MLDGGCFMRAGWVHDLKIYPYSEVDENRFVIKGKVSSSLKNNHIQIEVERRSNIHNEYWQDFCYPE